MKISKKTTVVGIKLTEQDYILWDLLCMEYQQTISEFITITVTQYLEAKTSEPIHDSRLIFRLKQYFEQNKDKTKIRTLTFRINSKILADWDNYCQRRYINRTSLIKQAVNGRIDPAIGRYFSQSDPNLVLLQTILDNMISKIGLIEYEDIVAIFEKVDLQKLNYILNNLEDTGKIGRKGWNTYVSSRISLGITDALLIAGNLGRFVDYMQEYPEMVEMSDHDSLLNVVFQYLGAIFARIKTPNFKLDMNNLMESKEQIMDLLK